MYTENMYIYERLNENKAHPMYTYMFVYEYFYVILYPFFIIFVKNQFKIVVIEFESNYSKNKFQ